MVCRPGLAHQRLTPGNAADLLFDDVLWVQEAQKDHYDFVLKMRERDTEVELAIASALAAESGDTWLILAILGRGHLRVHENPARVIRSV